MMPFDAYRCYISLKSHFTKESYDYHKVGVLTRVKKETFYKRKDRFWFEKFSRQKNDKEVVDFFVSNFVSTTDPSRMYIGELVKNGEERYVDWKKRTQSLSYMFKEESEFLFKDHKMDEVFDCSKGHPIVLRKFLGGNISLETLVIYDRILGYGNDSDIVRSEMAEIHQLQEEIYSSVMNFPYMNAAAKTEHINLLSELVEKQKIMYARLSLSDDPDAEIMKQEMTKSAEMMGLPKGVDMSVIFNQMSEMIELMRKQFDIGTF